MSEGADEAAIDPDRPIIDPHHHLWHIQAVPGWPLVPQRFLFEEMREMVTRAGHNVTDTVFAECHAMYRREGPDELKSLGETEFVNGIAAMSASGAYGSCRIAHRLLGQADLRLGDAVAPVLEAHVRAAGERFRGVRVQASHRDDPLFGFPVDPERKGLLLDERFRAGAAVLARMDLSLDIWCLPHQLGELADFAGALSDLPIVLDHLGTPDWRGWDDQARRAWIADMSEVALRPNVSVKLGGLGMDLSKAVGAVLGEATSMTLASSWRPYIEPAVEAFGAERCMFESNFPPDAASASYGATWNAFKRIAAGLSQAEQDRLFRGTAATTYRI